MVVADTDVLSVFAKVRRLALLFALFRDEEICTTPGVLAELQRSLDAAYDYALDVFAAIASGQIRLAHLTREERDLRDGLPPSLGRGEREIIAIAQGRNGVAVSNESRVRHHCRELGVACLGLPDLLRGLWRESLLGQDEVRELITEVEVQDRTTFREAVVALVFSDDP